jgi:serine/threonine protein kinase
VTLVETFQRFDDSASPDAPSMAKSTIGPSKEPTSMDFLAAAQRADEIGRLGGYIVRRLLGQGGMGMVFHAEDAHLQRPVALKVLKPDLAKNPEYRERFLRESRAAAALQSDHVVRIYQAGEDRGIPFLAMEFLQGGPLYRGSPMPALRAVRLAKEIALGLAAAHERGLIHRDIKPANIWLEAPHDRVKILDFGLVRSTKDELQLTQTGLVVGTPAYMSPEQARGEALDFRTDLFSLGSVLYEMLAGEQAFKRESITALLTALLLAEPPPLEERRPELPPALSQLVHQLLAKKPADRPASAREVAQALGQIEAEILGGPTVARAVASIATVGPVPGNVTPPPLAPSVSPPSQGDSGPKERSATRRRGTRSSRIRKAQKKRRRSLVIVIIGVGMLCALLLGASAVLWLRPGPPPWHLGGPPRVGDVWRPGEPTPPGWPPNRPMPKGWRHGDPFPSDALREPSR